MTHPANAAFVVLEGLDGVGKTTLARNLAEHLGGEYMSTPGTSFSDLRSKMLACLGGDQLGRALFYCATVSSQGRRARNLVNSGRPVVMDRYWPSTLAYAKARGVTANLDSLASSIEDPDVSVLVTIDERQRRERLDERGMTNEDLETLCPSFSEIVSRELERRCSFKTDVTGLNRESSVIKVAELIKSAAGFSQERIVTSA